METIKNIQSIIAFEKVARNLSYTEAAKELKISKSQISKLVQQLEDDMGQRLLNRSTRVVKLTEAGEKFYESCSASFKHLEMAQNELRQNSLVPKGRIKITLAGAFGENTVTPIISTFVKRYPQVQVELSFEHKIVNLIKGSYDIAIRIGHLPDSSLISKKIATRKEMICASSNYLNLNGVPEKPDDLQRFNCLSSRGKWSIYYKKKVQNFSVSGNIISNNARSILNATLMDVGICCLPQEYVKSYVDSGELVHIMKDYTTHEVPIWLLTSTKKNQSLAVKAFIKELSAALQTV